MMGFENWLPNPAANGIYLLLLWAAGAVAVLVVVLGALAFREDGMRGTLTVLLRGAGVLVFAALAWGWLDLSLSRERAEERRALEMRAAELTARALAPGSALACLDGLTYEEAAEQACAKALFASPQSAAAAVAYTEARLQLLADSVEFAKRDKTYSAVPARLRPVLEADRFGVVAEALARRGCNAERCPEFTLFVDARKVQTNLKEGTFSVQLARHLPNWRAPDPATAADTSSPSTPPAGAGSPEASLPGSASKYNFPSAASIPPISIMNAEPTGSTPVGPGAVVGPPAPEPQKPSARAQSGSRTPGTPRRPPPPQSLGPEN
jgi:hypothetical protein